MTERRDRETNKWNYNAELTSRTGSLATNRSYLKLLNFRSACFRGLGEKPRLASTVNLVARPHPIMRCLSVINKRHLFRLAGLERGFGC